MGDQPAVLTTALSMLPFGQSLAIGMMIGLERGWSGREELPGTRVAGIRTFALLGLAGGIAGALPAVAAAVLLFVAGLVILAGYYHQAQRIDGQSSTSAVTGIIVLALGMLAVRGQAIQALAIAAAVTFLLSMRRPLHGMLRDLSEAELRGAARFAILAFVLLPLAPDRAIGPYDAWNPRQLVFVVVLVTAISFVAYVLSRRTRSSTSMLLVAGLGAMVSSTAVTLALSRRLATAMDGQSGLALGIATASCVSVARVCLLVGLLAPRALGSVALVLGPALVVLIGVALWQSRGRSVPTTEAIALGNPLEIRAALVLALLVAVSSVASRWALDINGDLGAASVLAVIGAADVDAAVLAFATMPVSQISSGLAGTMLAAPVLLNLLIKAGITIGTARSRTRRAASLPLLGAAAVMGLAMALAVYRSG